MGLAVGALACASDPPSEVVGPYTGQTYRYAVDSIRVPMTQTEVRDLGGDLDANGQFDNQLGSTIAMQAGMGNVTRYAGDMIAAGVILSSIEITADDLQNDPTVGVRYLGTDDSPAVEIGGRIEDGRFRSNYIAYASEPGEAELHLPVFAEADPSLVKAIALEMTLAPDGSGGFDAEIHAAIADDDALWEAVYRGISQMVASDPGGHLTMLSILEGSPRDGVISYDEVRNNSLLVSLLAPDVVVDGRRVLSLGFRAHARPCAEGACNEGVAFDHCFDRLLDGDESDLDCGGGCRSCEGGAVCRDAGDCETAGCDAGRCAAPSCTDGLRDGSETDVDCGSLCGDCAVGQRCYSDGDCASGECGEPCIDDPNDDWDCLFDGDGWSEDTCYPRP